MTLLIRLTRGKSALVDDADFAWLSQWKWCAMRTKRAWYAVRTDRENGRRKTVLMHRLLCEGNPQVDHINGDGLDNRRRNLRPATVSENHRNQRKTRGVSRYKGVCFDREKRMWMASIKVNGVNVFLGRFRVERRAARAYDAAAKSTFGRFARPNFGATS